VPLVYDAELGWRMAGNWRTRHHGADFDVAAVTDAGGLRVPETAQDRRRRGGLVVAGDSLTFGWGVEAEDCFGERLGAALGLPVSNLGVPGYGADQTLLALKRQMPALAPDCVLFTFCRNDLVEVQHGSRYGRAKPLFHLVAGRLEFSPASERSSRLERGLFLWRTVHGAFDRWRAGRWSVIEEPAPEEQALFNALVSGMADAAHRGGARFVLTGTLPAWLEAAPMSTRRGDLRVDLSPTFERAAAGGERLKLADGHWTASAHRLAADALAAAMRGGGASSGGS
jgi:lysophospholipase L1-like esterase